MKINFRRIWEAILEFLGLRKKRDEPQPIPGITPAPVPPPPPPKPAPFLGYYFAHSRRYSRDLFQVSGHTNQLLIGAFECAKDMDELAAGGWRSPLREALIDARDYGKKVYLQLDTNWEPAPAVEKVLNVCAQFWGLISHINIADEPDWTPRKISAEAEAVRYFVSKRGLAPKPIGLTLKPDQMHLAKSPGLDFVAVEAYLPDSIPGQSPVKVVNELRQKLNYRLSFVPPGRGFFVVVQSFTFGGKWTQWDSLAAMQYATWEVARNRPDFLGLHYFNWGRPDGAKHLPDVIAEHKRIAEEAL